MTPELLHACTGPAGAEVVTLISMTWTRRSNALSASQIGRSAEGQGYGSRRLMHRRVSSTSLLRWRTARTANDVEKWERSADGGSPPAGWYRHL